MKQRSEQGFTLVELLVALALLAMLMVAVPSTIRLANRASQSAAQLMENGDMARNAGFLTRTLAEAVPVGETDSDGALRIGFSGTPRDLSYVVALAQGPQGGGLYRVRVTIANAGEDSDITLALAPHMASPMESEGHLRRSQRRLGLARSGEAFRYYGVPAGKDSAEWSDTWTRAERLPELVEVPFASDEEGMLRTRAPLVVELQHRVHD